MVENDGKPKVQRAGRPRPKHPPSFAQRLRMAEREINKLAKLVRDFRKAYFPPIPKRSQRTIRKPANQGDKTSKST